MYTMCKFRSARSLAWLLVSIVAMPYLASGAAAATIGGAVTQSVVVFPIDAAEGTAVRQVASDLTEYLGNGLSASSRYQVVSYSDRLPAIQRLVTLQPDKKAASTGPFSVDANSVSNAVMLAKSMSADVLIVGSVNEYKVSENPAAADVKGSVEVIDGKTGKSLRTIALEGHAVNPVGTEGVNEARLRRDAVRDAGNRVIRQMTGMDYQEPVASQIPVVTAKKKSKTSWIPLLLLSLGAGLLLGNSGGSDNGGTPDDGFEPPPDPPAGF